LLVIAEVVDVCTYVLKWNVSALTSTEVYGVWNFWIQLRSWIYSAQTL